MEWNLGRTVEPTARAVEVVERKGRGHLDSMCDAIAEGLVTLPTLWRAQVAGEVPLDRAPLTPAGWR